MTDLFQTSVPTLQQAAEGFAGSRWGKVGRVPYCKGSVKIPEPAAPAPDAGFPNIVVNSGAPNAPGTKPVAPSAGNAPQVAATQSAPPAPRPRKKNWFSTGGGDSVSSDVSLVASGDHRSRRNRRLAGRDDSAEKLPTRSTVPGTRLRSVRDHPTDVLVVRDHRAEMARQ